MFTQPGFGSFVGKFLAQARERYGIEFEDQYPNTAVYTLEAKGAWACATMYRVWMSIPCTGTDISYCGYFVDGTLTGR